MSKTEKLIGICGSHLFEQQPIQLINSIRTEAVRRGYRITALSCEQASAEGSVEIIRDRELIRLIRHLPLCGLIVLSEKIVTPSLQKLILNICQEKNIPVFSINGTLDGSYNMPMDDFHGFEQMVRHVIEKHNCRRINMLAGKKGDPFSENRIARYKQVLSDHHIPFEEERLAYGDFWDRPARQAVRHFLASSLPFPEAIVCANDSMAIAAYSELQAAGYNVPEDVLLTGYDGILSSQYHFPVITTCKPDFTEASSFIIQELDAFLTQKQFVPHEHKIHMIPQIEQSCGCIPKTMHNLNHVVSGLFQDSDDTTWHNLSMEQLITANLSNNNLTDFAAILPQHLHMWKGQFRFACVKASLLSSCDIPDTFTDLTSILDIRSGQEYPTGRILTMEDFVSDIYKTPSIDTTIITLLCSGTHIYGYNVDGFNEINIRSMQRCNEFAFYLSYCLNTIVHNAKLCRANEEISKLMMHDPMTDLYNRRGFYHEMDRILRIMPDNENYLFIFALDMDRLKYINDTFGHADGDFALTTLANAILEICGQHSVCARFGGDEFVVALIGNSETSYCVSEFLEKINTHICQTDGVREKPYTICASVGMHCLPITSSMNLNEMIAVADAKMYKMKRENRQTTP